MQVPSYNFKLPKNNNRKNNNKNNNTKIILTEQDRRFYIDIFKMDVHPLNPEFSSKI